MNHTSTRHGTFPRNLLSFLLRPGISDASRASALVRVATGGVFVASGLLKFLYENQGPGRFARIGLPFPLQLSAFVGTVEVVAGTLLVLGLLVRAASLPLVFDMIVAIATTKIPLLFGPGPEPIGAPPKTGFWAFAYQARLDVTMLLACSFFVIAGAGLWSLDALLARRRWEGRMVHDVRAQEPA